ncbi:carboxylesterase (biotin synthesis protein BioH) [Escherichia coli]|uniref:Carboxylesterase (Biotin synthesis protein BioH) n=1 Tax=Escherichia coli TaxID=562 RepID=A0A376TX70_ECOLX|nr:carboxylesterase (biotin synthesis protein BioH) [Escherichia coli]STF64884.1 carboxylesterase (biotin synthesis protein BioH) [Escherichia coli]STI81709.1 carboxylesterase (biotin synthesis protein BioH) [Escherichia coli]
MNNIWWQTKGQGNVHLVLLHGWGLNAEVWRCIDEELSSHFTLHLVDLPGFGRSRDLVRCHLLIWPKPCCNRHLIKPFG